MTKTIARLWFAVLFIGFSAALQLWQAPVEAKHSLSACGHASSFGDIPCTEVDRAITEAAKEFNLDGDKFRRVARCESGFNPFNSSRSYYGLFQHLKTEWTGRAEAFNRGYNPNVLSNPHSPFDNARVAAWMIHNGGWGPWPECGR